MEALGLCGFKQRGRSGDKGDVGAFEHVARREGSAKLQGVRPAELGAVEKLARAFKTAGLSGCCTMRADSMRRVSSAGAASRADIAGAFAAADGGVDLKRRGGRDELAIVFHGFHEPDQRVCARLLHKELDERRGFKKGSSLISPFLLDGVGERPPCTATGWKRCASSGMPASARLRRMVVVG